MSIWKDNTAPRTAPTPAPDAREPARFDAPPKPDLARSPAAAPVSPPAAPSPAAAPVSPAAAPLARAEAGLPRKESLIAADITIEGKIEGGGSVRIAGKFKGDVNVQGDLTIEAGAKLTGGVRADKVTIAGELEGNVEEASLVNLLPTAVVIGDLKAGSLTVAAGARLRGQAEFGWDDGKGSKAGKHSNGHRAETGAGS
ncbi:MAG: polymer-forming cytoskeletal protein [Pseudomonadota bacterium]|nr:polymer-forming cytoskeletal protein [Pseudomonadota bacterium]